MIEKEKVLDLINKRLNRIYKFINWHENEMKEIENDYRDKHNDDWNPCDCMRTCKRYAELCGYRNEEYNARGELFMLLLDIDKI